MTKVNASELLPVFVSGTNKGVDRLASIVGEDIYMHLYQSPNGERESASMETYLPGFSGTHRGEGFVIMDAFDRVKQNIENRIDMRADRYIHGY